MPSCCHVRYLYLISTLLNTDIDNEEESIDSELQDLTTLHWQKLVHITMWKTEIRVDLKWSSLLNINILDKGSMTVRDASIDSAMVPIHFSQLIGQMRGTSHVSPTTW